LEWCALRHYIKAPRVKVWVRDKCDSVRRTPWKGVAWTYRNLWSCASEASCRLVIQVQPDSYVGTVGYDCWVVGESVGQA
jgi:hypothetical protein